jgi:hypothetical protein
VGESAEDSPDASAIVLDQKRRRARPEVWKCFGEKLPKAEVEYFCQIFLIYIIVITSIINVALGVNPQIFMTLLGMSLTGILPGPSLANTKDSAN